jgi:poly(A) RNA polymerase GLD2
MVIHYLQAGVRPAILPALQQVYPDKFSVPKDLTAVKLEETALFERVENRMSLGKLFIGFLDYYANQFNFEEHAISVRLGQAIPIDVYRFAPNPNNDPYQWKCLCIEGQ